MKKQTQSPSPGKKRVTRADVAASAGVSKATVSVVLNEQYKVSIPETTREMVRQAAQKVGYKPNRMAKILSSGKMDTIGIWVMDLRDPFCCHFADHMQRIISQTEFRTMIADAPRERFEQSYAHFSDWPLDGVAAFLLDHHVQSYVKDKTTSSPIINVARKKVEGADSIILDFELPFRELMKTLLSKGSKRITYATDAHDFSKTEPRRQIYEEEMKAAHLPVTFLAVKDRLRSMARDAFIQNYAAQKQTPEAIVCYSDEIAVGIQRGVQDLGLRVPEDIIVTGVNGTTETEYTNPRITTVAFQMDPLCQKTWDMLRWRIANPAAPFRSEIFSAHLDIRGSGPV